MIYLNNSQDTFTKFLESVETSPYDLAMNGALMHIYNEQRFLDAINGSIAVEYKDLLETSTVDDLKDAINEKNILKAVFKLIDVLISLISKGLRIIMGIAKKFLYRASDVNKDNKVFLSKYKKSLKAIDNHSVDIDGYSMDKDLTGIAMSIENSNDDFFRTAVTKVTGGEEVFIGPDSLLEKISSNRSTILNSINYNADQHMLKRDKEWQSECRFACFGSERSLTYSVADALAVIEKYNNNKDFILKISEQVKHNCDRDIKELENLKKLMKGSNLSNSKALVGQFQLLNRYRTQTMQDAIYAFTTLIEYVDVINKQAKSICIIAMQEN